MQETITIEKLEPVVFLSEGIVYGQRKEWAGASWRPLRLSLMRERAPYPEPPRVLPLIIWLCGGAFVEVDRNVWLPEMLWFAKKGFAVASVEYSVHAKARFPSQLLDVKEAIRFLRANAGEFALDKARFAIMGESAGGYLAAAAALTTNNADYDKGLYIEESGAVQAAVCLYPVTSPASAENRENIQIPPDFLDYTDLPALARTPIGKGAPPMFLLHGTADTVVDESQSEALYKALAAQGARVDFLRVQGAGHAADDFFQSACKEKIAAFLNSALG